MRENEMINGWTFEETVKTAENLMEVEKNMFKWDVLRHLRDYAENYKDKVQQFEAIGTIEEFKALKENERKCKDCAGCTIWKCDCANERAYAIDEFAETLLGQKVVDKSVVKRIAEQMKVGDFE